MIPGPRKVIKLEIGPTPMSGGGGSLIGGDGVLLNGTRLVNGTLLR